MIKYKNVGVYCSKIQDQNEIVTKTDKIK